MVQTTVLKTYQHLPPTQCAQAHAHTHPNTREITPPDFHWPWVSWEDFPAVSMNHWCSINHSLHHLHYHLLQKDFPEEFHYNSLQRIFYFTTKETDRKKCNKNMINVFTDLIFTSSASTTWFWFLCCDFCGCLRLPPLHFTGDLVVRFRFLGAEGGNTKAKSFGLEMFIWEI